VDKKSNFSLALDKRQIDGYVFPDPYRIPSKIPQSVTNVPFRYKFLTIYHKYVISKLDLLN
jgi:hypothetical protein